MLELESVAAILAAKGTVGRHSLSRLHADCMQAVWVAGRPVGVCGIAYWVRCDACSQAVVAVVVFAAGLLHS